MGGSSSKAVRKLPTQASSAARSTPAWAGARTPHPDHAPAVSSETTNTGKAYDSSPAPTYRNQESGSSSYGQSQQPVWRDNSTGGNVGSSSAGRPGFSGEKDDGQSLYVRL